jgi:hypothetical protein
MFVRLRDGDWSIPAERLRKDRAAAGRAAAAGLDNGSAR